VRAGSAGPQLSRGAELRACRPGEGSLGRSRRGQKLPPLQPLLLHTHTELSINQSVMRCSQQ